MKKSIHTWVPAVALKTTGVIVSECDVFPVESCLEEAIAGEQSWAEHALSLLGTELGSTDACMGCQSCFHATSSGRPSSTMRTPSSVL